MVEFNATFIICMLSFAIFILIMNAIFYRPILNIIRKRNEFIALNDEKTQENIESSQKLEDEYNKELELAKTESRKKLNLEIENAQKQSSQETLEARGHAKDVVQSRKQELEKQKDEILTNLAQNAVEDIAQTITAKIFNKCKVVE